MRRTILMLAALACAAVGAFTAPVYTNRYVSNGVTYSQFGGVKASNYVATAISDVALVGGYTGTVKRAAYASVAAQSTNALVAVSATNIISASGPMNYRELTNAVLVAAGAKVDALESDLRDGRKDVAYADTANYALAAATANATESIIDSEHGGQYYWSDIAAMTNGLRAGNYAAVSNAAMNARSMTDLGVRGEPQGEWSWFTLNEERLEFNDGVWGDRSSSRYIDLDGMGGYSLYYSESAPPVEFSLDQDYTFTIGEYTVVGYTNTLAQVSQIPDVSGYATQQQATNAAVAVADAKISTNNAAFVAAVTNCPVVIASGGGGGGGFPAGDWSDYGTLGALLAAIIAAITWLKNNQRYALHTVTLTNGAGTLLDRAGNSVVVSGDTTLTLPALEYAGRLRDFLVRLEISGSTVPTITFAAPTGETIAYETDGDEFPVPDEAGNWLYSFTESCVAHKFAVSLKKVNAVTQGGS